MPKSYVVTQDGKSIRCLACNKASYNQHDVVVKYCGNCHKFLDNVTHCDFCGREYAGVRDFIAKTQFRGRLQDRREVVDADMLWATCDDCWELIQKENWNALVERGVDGVIAAHAAFRPEDRDIERKNVIALYKLVFGDEFKP